MVEFFVWFIIIVVALSVIGGVLRWVFVFLSIRSAVRQTQVDLNSLLPEIQQMLEQAQRMPANQLNFQPSELSEKIMQANRELRDLDDLQKAKYDAKVGELMGMANEVGYDASFLIR